MSATSDLAHIRIEARDDGVVVATLDRPPVNALGRDLVREITELSARLAGDERVRALVLTATGKVFCAGADLKERRGMSEDQVVATVKALAGAMNAVAAVPFPTIAAIQGLCLGGGFELALGCDMRVLADDARIGLPECGLAIIPGGGATQRLPRLIGPSRAKKWILSAEVFGAAEALADGAVDAVVPRERVLDEALTLAGRIAACGPLAVRAAKRAIDGAMDAPSLAEGLDLEWAGYETIIPTEDRLEALAAFAEKRKPVFKGR